MTKIFISYSRRDRDFVQKLTDDLQKRLPDANIFYDMLIEPGASWAQTLATQIESADVILAVMSPDYLASQWAQQELNVAMERRLESQARVLPLFVRPCSPTGFLSQLTWIDFTEDYESALPRLIWSITGEKPQAARGAEPPEPMTTFTEREKDDLRREVTQQVAMFKSPGKSADGPPGEAPKPKSRRRKKLKCFVIMPFGDQDLQVVYDDFVKPTLEARCELHCERGDDVFGSNIVMDDILQSIGGADIVVADLTRKNANVFYEVGICHTLNKPVVLLAQSIDDVPFDLRHRRVLLYEYSPRGCRRLEGSLGEHVLAVLATLN